MKGKTTILLIAITVGGTLLIFAILLIDKSIDNGFNRKFISPRIKQTRQIILTGNKSLACNTKRGIWIQQREDPLVILKVDDSLNSTGSISMKLPNQFNSNLRNYYYTQVNNSSAIITNEVGDIARVATDNSVLFSMRFPKFDLSISTSPNTVFVRAFRGKGDQSHLEITKINISDTASIQKSYVIPKQFDGIFCSDGRLNYDPKTCRLYYMYYYRGEFVCLDTNLNVIYTAKTIDTVRTANLGIKYYNKVAKNGKIMTKKTTTGSSILVNHFFNIANNKVYIKSALKADNQTTFEFLNSSTIDVYSADNGKYLYSFNFPLHNTEKLREFTKKGNNFYAFYKNHLVLFSFTLPQ